MTVDASTFTGNTAINGGGALAVQGSVTVIGSTFSGNTSSSAGGGAIQVPSGGSATLINSTFHGNSGPAGGGLGVESGVTRATVLNCTFSSNSSPSGSNLGSAAAAGILVLRNTIVADGTGSNNCVGSVTDQGGNLDTAASCGFSVGNGSKPNTAAGLAAGLQSNGGPTQTIALLSGSAALDAGDPNSCADPNTVNNLDQRGFLRPVNGDAVPGAICDIGAFEFGAAPPPTPTATPTITATPTVTRTATASATRTPTATGTPSSTPVSTQTPTTTSTQTPTAPPTQTPTATLTSIPADTPTETPSLTPTGTLSLTPTETFTSVATPSLTSSPTGTATAPPAGSPTLTSTRTPLPTASAGGPRLVGALIAGQTQVSFDNALPQGTSVRLFSFTGGAFISQAVSDVSGAGTFTTVRPLVELEQLAALNEVNGQVGVHRFVEPRVVDLSSGSALASVVLALLMMGLIWRASTDRFGRRQ